MVTLMILMLYSEGNKIIKLNLYDVSGTKYWKKNNLGKKLEWQELFLLKWVDSWRLSWQGEVGTKIGIQWENHEEQLWGLCEYKKELKTVPVSNRG